MTLLPNNRFGSYLLYSVGGVLTYFVAVYTNPGSSGVVTQLPFMTAINPATDQVAIGANATAAYDNLLAEEAGNPPPITTTVTGTTTTTSTESSTSRTTSTATTTNTMTDQQALLSGISVLASSSSLTMVNATTVNPNVFIQVAKVSVSQSGVNAALAQVKSLIQTYGPGSAGDAVYVWSDSAGNLNAGIFQVKSGVTDLYYVTMTP